MKDRDDKDYKTKETDLDEANKFETQNAPADDKSSIRQSSFQNSD